MMPEPRLLAPEDLDGAMRLKEAANWNQTREDWLSVMRFSPEGCFGVDIDGTLAATATALCFADRLAWIGMVLTAPEHRGKGLARRLMERAIEWIESRGVDWIKLDATDMGRPLYAKLGFADECAVERWGRSADAPAVAPPDAPLADREPDPALDREAFGADRAEWLRALTPFGRIGFEGGYAMGRPGSKAAYFGPCVARDAARARVALAWHIARNPGKAIYWDILETNPAALQIAREFGFTPLRRLIRMARPGVRAPRALPHNDALVYAIAGFECG
jgi:GNAT superfamily N-acetyltransferase